MVDTRQILASFLGVGGVAALLLALARLFLLLSLHRPRTLLLLLLVLLLAALQVVIFTSVLIHHISRATTARTILPLAHLHGTPPHCAFVGTWRLAALSRLSNRMRWLLQAGTHSFGGWGSSDHTLTVPFQTAILELARRFCPYAVVAVAGRRLGSLA